MPGDPESPNLDVSRLDLSSEPPSPGNTLDDACGDCQSNAQPDTSSSRPFLGIQFRCCQTYGRIYRSEDEMAYRGNCPKCGRALRVPIGKGGTGQRFFEAG
ncbi:MAG: hypothetical protein AAGA03_06205 [Planctomycetota bacterium]